MLVAPLDANTLAKMTCGISDNLLLSVLRAWDPDGAFNPLGRVGRQKWLGVAPAMNTAMWLHPVTKGQIRVLEVEWGDDGDGGKRTWAKVLKPVEKELACGDRGVGAMMDWRDIVEEVLEQVRKFD